MSNDVPPIWSRALGAVVVGLPVFVVFALTVVAWAWRDTEPAWLLPVMILGELVVIALLIALRKVWLYPFAGTFQSRVGAGVYGGIVLVALGWMLLGPSYAPAPPSVGKKVAVVGAGSGGVHAAWMLRHAGADVTIFEASPYVGGHAYAYPYEDDNGTVYPIDMGFMFGSPVLYKEFKTLLSLYEIPRNQTRLSMAVQLDGEWWATGPDVSDEVKRFQTLADEQCEQERWNTVPFWMWLKIHGFDEDFKRRYIAPLMAVLFITDRGVYNISTRFMLKMAAGRTQWVNYLKGAKAWTVNGASTRYYQAISAEMMDDIRPLTPVTKVTRNHGKVQITSTGPNGETTEEFDAAVLAVPGNVARAILHDSSWLEDFILGQVRYEQGEVIIHTDAAKLPKDDSGSNYMVVQEESYGDVFEMHAWPVKSQADDIVLEPMPIATLNPQKEYDDVRIRRYWRHYVQDLWHSAWMLEGLGRLQGRGNVWYAGDWVTFIGHGPAMASGMKAACEIAGREPLPEVPSEPCFDVTLEDAVPALGIEEMTHEVCGRAGVFRELVRLACDGEGMK